MQTNNIRHVTVHWFWGKSSFKENPAETYRVHDIIKQGSKLNLTILYTDWQLTILWNFRSFAMVASKKRTLTPDTWSYRIWDLHLFLCWDYSLLNLSCFRTFNFEHPRYFYFASGSAYPSGESYKDRYHREEKKQRDTVIITGALVSTVSFLFVIFWIVYYNRYTSFPGSANPSGESYKDRYHREEKKQRDTVIITGALVSTVSFLFVIFWIVYYNSNTSFQAQQTHQESLTRIGITGRRRNSVTRSSSPGPSSVLCPSSSSSSGSCITIVILHFQAQHTHQENLTRIGITGRRRNSETRSSSPGPSSAPCPSSSSSSGLCIIIVILSSRLSIPIRRILQGSVSQGGEKTARHGHHHRGSGQHRVLPLRHLLDRVLLLETEKYWWRSQYKEQW